MIEQVFALIIDGLKQRRIERGLSLNELAEKIGTSKSAVWSWENNEKCPTLWNAAKWIDALGYELVIEEAKEATMPEITDHTVVLKKTSRQMLPDRVAFTNSYEHDKFREIDNYHFPKSTWEELGSPEEITVMVVAGNQKVRG